MILLDAVRGEVARICSYLTRHLDITIRHQEVIINIKPDRPSRELYETMHDVLSATMSMEDCIRQQFNFALLVFFDKRLLKIEFDPNSQYWYFLEIKQDPLRPVELIPIMPPVPKSDVAFSAKHLREHFGIEYPIQHRPEPNF